MNCIARGTGSLPGREAYMIPFGMFYIVPTFVTAAVWFVPEVSSEPWFYTACITNPDFCHAVPALAHPQGSRR